MDRPEDRLALIELHERDGRSARPIDVLHWPLLLGRGLDNTLVLDDPHVAAAHARIEPDDQGMLVLHVGDTANGVLLDGRPLAAGAQQALPRGGALLQLGNTRLRLRLRDEVLAPEQRLDPGAYRMPAWALAGVALALLASMLVGHWIALDPGADFTAWLPTLLGLPVAVIAWCGLWALASKLFQHRFDFVGHLRIVLPWLLAIELADWMLPQLGATLGAPLVWHLATPVGGLLLALQLRAQLRHVLPLHGRAVTLAVGTLAVVAGGVSLANIHRSTDRFARAPYMSTLPLPALRLTGASSAQALIDDMAPLRDKLAARAKKARRDEGEDLPDDEQE